MTLKHYNTKFKDEHTIDHCDKCGENVGVLNLEKLPFLYKDFNDKNHENLGNGFRQYYVCKGCEKTC